MHATATEHTNWEYVDWVDLQPLPGSFVSPTYANYQVHGETIHALNYCHAEYTWLHRHVEASGEQWHQCCHCNHYIRYAVVFRSPDGYYHIVGQDCARFINSKLDRKVWLEKEKLSQVRMVNTKNGEKAVLSIDVPQWYWDIARENRPRFCSLSKYDKSTGRCGRTTIWSLSIWGETPGDVFKNLETLQSLQPKK
jgi:hypothetical protein